MSVVKRRDSTSPEPNLSATEIVACARQLVPYLREKSAEIEIARCIPPDVDQRLREAGFYRMLQPRQVGGYEFDLDIFIDAMLELFRGDGSTGWVTCFVAAHIMWVCALGEKAQSEIFADGGDVRTVVPGAPTGKARVVEGGYLISGRWDYCSGMSVGNWIVANAVVERQGSSLPPEIRTFASPSSNFQVEDNWHVMGLKGTGSVTSVAKDLFVPDYFTTLQPAMMFEFTAPGYGVYDNPFYSGPLVCILWMQLAIALTGMTRGLIETFIRDTALKLSPFPPFGPLKEDKKIQIAVGQAIADHELAKAGLRQVAANHKARIAQMGEGRRLGWADVRDDQLIVCKIARLCVDAADTLFHIAGSSMPIKSDSPFQRFYRDIKVASTHRAVALERVAENSGIVAFGLAPLANL